MSDPDLNWNLDVIADGVARLGRRTLYWDRSLRCYYIRLRNRTCDVMYPVPTIWQGLKWREQIGV